jgi:uncharacterized membrane protein
MVGLGDLPGGSFGSYANAASTDGSVIVGYGSGNNGIEAFRWTTSGGMVGLGGSGFANSIAQDLSGDGSTIVGYANFGSGDEALIWDATNGVRRLKGVLVNEWGLDLTGWTLTMANAVSADGTVIVGTGTNPSGSREAWIAVIPEPASLWLVAFGSLALIRRRRPRNG